MNKEERIREEIAKIIVKIIKADRAGRQTEVDAVSQILSIKGIRIEADNQDLPENPKPNPPDDKQEIASYNAYGSAQRDMLTPKDGDVWVKVKEE